MIFRGHQTHYEQVGELSGSIDIEGHPTRHVHLRSIRDHSFGIRNWCDLYRYAIHFIYVEEVCDMSRVMRNFASCICENKDAD